jgi:hypothetical protein
MSNMVIKGLGNGGIITGGAITALVGPITWMTTMSAWSDGRVEWGERRVMITLIIDVTH